MEAGSETNHVAYRTIFRVNALYAERSGWFKVYRAYVWETSIERARATAELVFKDAKHVAVKRRVD